MRKLALLAALLFALPASAQVTARSTLTMTISGPSFSCSPTTMTRGTATLCTQTDAGTPPVMFWGDGTANTSMTGSPATASHTYAGVGTFHPSLTDSLGTSPTGTITVNPVLGTLSLNPPTSTVSAVYGTTAG